MSEPDDLVIGTPLAANATRLMLLGSGELKAKLKITVNHATKSAKAAVEKAGGTVEVIEVKVLDADVAKARKSAAKKAKAQGGIATKKAGGEE